MVKLSRPRPKDPSSAKSKPPWLLVFSAPFICVILFLFIFMGIRHNTLEPCTVMRGELATELGREVAIIMQHDNAGEPPTTGAVRAEVQPIVEEYMADVSLGKCITDLFTLHFGGGVTSVLQ
jgi:hypothetical protein